MRLPDEPDALIDWLHNQRKTGELSTTQLNEAIEILYREYRWMRNCFEVATRPKPW